jgi:tetratricopeptide (TPR) repeat protein
MSVRSRKGRRWIAVALAVAVLVALIAGISVISLRRGAATLPGPGSEAYREMVSAFSAGVAALDVDANDRAQVALTRATQLVPEEPAAWADRGLLAIRLGDFEAAVRDLGRARELAPESGAVEGLLGLLEGRRGQFAAAIAHLRRAVEREPGDLKARFALAQEVERQGGPDSEAEAQRLVEAILALQPDNLAVLLERARLAAKRGDAGALGEAIARLGTLAGPWPPRAQEQYRALGQAAQGNLRLAATRVAFLRNVLLPVPAFRQALDAVQTPPGTVGEPIERFLRLPPPAPTPAPPDTALSFAVERVAGATTGRWDSLLAVSLTGEGPPAVFTADGREVRRADAAGAALPFPGGAAATPPSPHGILALDLDSDYRMDLALAGAGGLRIFRQKEDGTFADVTTAAGLDPGLSGAASYGAWAADIEMDGDLDVVLGLREAVPTVLRNNGDGTFGVLHPFEAISGLRDFAWADLDGDGDPDAGLLDDSGGLRVFANERSGQFRPRPVPGALGRPVALAVADVDADGTIDLLALREDGSVLRISDAEEGRAWGVAEVVRRPTAPVGTDRLFVADLDNNGGLDLIGSGSAGGWIALSDGRGGFRPSAVPSGLRVAAVADLNGDGRLDLAGLDGAGRPVRGVGRGAKDYHWQVIRPKAARVFGDGRINAFGVGGEVEVRAGLLVQRQVIAGPVLHFGLGEHPRSDVARIVWPNGTTQAEFDAKADQAVLAEQRLKGSCPFVYAFDGAGIRFVTDFLWRSPLGLRINAQDTAGVMQTEDWVKIRGDQLAPQDGYYDLRITAELWETHFFDHVALLVVDHPEGTEVFVDERFARRPPPLALHPTGPLHPVASARDDAGRDVTDIVRARDDRHLDTFGRGPYQGVTRDHWVEVELGEDVPRDRPLRLVARGWIHPTDSSINVALGQGRHAPPQGLVLEVPTRAGDWVVARPDLGFPAGKDKTILVDLDGVFRPGAPRRLRLRTNLEIFWDALAVAVAADDTPMHTRRLAPRSAELRPRGYSLMTQADAGSPERPRYDTIVGTGQRWRDLIGHYTRFGDVRELLAGVDDRYVIANAGDELALRFAAPPPPSSGHVRDFVLIGDGWNKDGDYNTAFSKTVLPLPSHDRPSYDTPPGALEDDPVYRRHPGDWEEYHTRYVTPSIFQGGLKPGALPCR